MSFSYYTGPDGQPVNYYTTPGGPYQSIPVSSEYYYPSQSAATTGATSTTITATIDASTRPRRQATLKQPISPPISPPSKAASLQKAKKKAPSSTSLKPGADSLVCQHCFETFTRKCDLTKHLKNHDRKYKCDDEECPFAERGFASDKDLGRHCWERHHRAPFAFPNFPQPQLKSCDQPGCTYSCSREANLDSHKEVKHGVPYIRTKGKNKGKDLTKEKAAGARSKRGKTPEVLAPTAQRVTKSRVVVPTTLRRSARLDPTMGAGMGSYAKTQTLRSIPSHGYLPSPSQSPEPDYQHQPAPYPVETSRLYQPPMGAGLMHNTVSSSQLGHPALGHQPYLHPAPSYNPPAPAPYTYPSASMGGANPSLPALRGSGPQAGAANSQGMHLSGLQSYVNPSVILYSQPSKATYPTPPTPPTETYQSSNPYEHTVFDPSLVSRHPSSVTPVNGTARSQASSNYDGNSDSSYQQKYVSFDTLMAQNSRAAVAGAYTPPYEEDKIDYRLLHPQQQQQQQAQSSAGSHHTSPAYQHSQLSQHSHHSHHSAHSSQHMSDDSRREQKKSSEGNNNLFSDLLTMDKMY